LFSKYVDGFYVKRMLIFMIEGYYCFTIARKIQKMFNPNIIPH